MTTAQTAIPAGHRIPLANIVASKTNPRKTFDAKKLEELAASIKDHDVIQPILVRPTGPDKFELVAGERRFRASKIAGKPDIPATVRELTDEQCLQIQVIENLQRDDLHPIEEAEGYEQLMKLQNKDGKKHTADDIALQVGKSKSYVYAKLKLLDLIPEGRKACFDGQITESVALLISRIPAKDLQKDALKQILGNFNREEPMTYRQAFDHISRHYMLVLKDATFDTGDAKLLPAAGACGACPKRTGNQKELFGDVKSADVCTDPRCYKAKQEAHVEIIKAKAEAEGKTIITGKKALEIFPYPNYSGTQGGYVKPDAHDYLNGKLQSYKAVLGKDMPKPELVINPHTKALQEVVSDRAIKAALKAKGVKVGYGGDSSPNKSAAAAQKREKIEKAARLQIYLAVREKVTEGLTLDDFRLVAHQADGLINWPKPLLDAWDPPENAKKNENFWARDQRIKTRIETMPAPELLRFLLDYAASALLNVYRHNTAEDKKRAARIDALAERYKVDHAAIRKQLQDDAKAKEKPKATVKKKAADKPTKGTKRAKPVAAYLRPVTPKPALAAIIGAEPQPRIEITSKIWTYIKKHGLQDKTNKRMINADTKLQAVFGGKKQVSIFEMTKLVSAQVEGAKG